MAWTPISPTKKEKDAMKKLLSSLVVIAGLTGPAIAQSECGRNEQECYTEPDEASLVQHCCYKNRDGHKEHAPAQSKLGTPKRATALCGDDFFSFSEHPEATCSYHQGVKKRIGREDIE
jgi:Protein of unknown function (DUF3761)